MASTHKKYTRIRGVQKGLQGAEPYKVNLIKLAETCYIDKENLKSLRDGYFPWTLQEARWTGYPSQHDS